MRLPDRGNIGVPPAYASLSFGRLVRFLVIGTVGFAVDAGLLLALVPSMGHYAARAVSLPTAVLVTWAFNRSWTFRDRRSSRRLPELMRYAAAQSLGALANYGVYAVCVTALAWMARYPVAAVAVGSGCGLAMNFTAMHLVVFRRTR